MQSPQAFAALVFENCRVTRSNPWFLEVLTTEIRGPARTVLSVWLDLGASFTFGGPSRHALVPDAPSSAGT